VALLCLSTSAHAWWNTDWSYRTHINLDTGTSGVALTEPIAQVPVLVRLHPGNFNFSDVKPDGGDLRFVAGDDHTQLRFHLEKMDAREQIVLAWVDVPNLAPSSPSAIYVYYGNPKATSVGSPSATYSADDLVVWHFSGSELPTDSTTNANSATAGP